MRCYFAGAVVCAVAAIAIAAAVTATKVDGRDEVGRYTHQFEPRRPCEQGWRSYPL